MRIKGSSLGHDFGRAMAITYLLNITVPGAAIVQFTVVSRELYMRA